MANFVYRHAIHLIGTAALDLEAAGTAAQLKAALVMDTTTADTELDVTSMAGFTTLAECNGANYARQTLTNVTWSKDATNGRSELKADPSVFNNLGAGTTPNQAAIVIFQPDGTPANQIPISWYDTGGFPFQGTGSPNTINWNSADGVLFIRSAAA
jgi:hypothetical protein